MSSNTVSANVASNAAYFEPNNDPLFDKNPGNVRLSANDDAAAKKDDPIIARETVSLENKPAGTTLGEHLTRQALEKLAARYGLDSTDIELEIQYIKEKEKSDFISNLRFGKTEVKNPDSLTDDQVNALIAKGNKTVNFGIHESTVKRMLERNEIVKWLAQRHALNIPITEQDEADLARLGYTREDVGKLRDAKYMQYLGYQEKALADVNELAKQKLIADRIEELEKNPEQVIKEGDNTTPSRMEFLIRATATKEINDALANSKMTPLEYTASKENFEKSLAELRAWEERTSKMPYSTYLKEGGKNLLNSFYWGIGEAVKGLSVMAVNSSIYYDQNGKPFTPKVSDTLGYKLGDWIQQNVQAPNVNKDIERTFTGGVMPKTVGGLLPAVFGAWATKNPMATVSIYDGLRTGGGIYDEAKAKGATETQAQNAALLTGGFVGLTDRFGYGKTLQALNTGAGAKTWQTIFSEAIKDGGRNAAVAGGQTIFENGVARQTYDPNRSYLQNIEQRMIAAGITGSALKGGLNIIAKIKAGKNPAVLAETQRVFNIKTQVEPNNARQIEFRNSGIDLKAKLKQKLEAAEMNKLEKSEKSANIISQRTPPPEFQSKVSKADRLLVPASIEKIKPDATDLSRAVINERAKYQKEIGKITGKNFAAFEYIDDNGKLQVKIMSSSDSGQHSERRIGDWMKEQGIKPEKVTRVHSELEPCVTPQAFCKPYLAINVPQAKISYSFEYGDTISKVNGLRERNKYARQIFRESKQAEQK